MNEHDLVRKVISTFESLDVSYFVTGSMASIAMGEPRYTNNIDIVTDISSDRIVQLLAAFPLSEYEHSELTDQKSVSKRFHLSIIHPPTGLAANIMLLADDDFERLRMSRRVQLEIDEETTGWFSSPEDVILKKLVFFKLGGTEKHLRDISGVLLVQGKLIDQEYLTLWAEKLGVSEELTLVRQKLSEREE